MNWCRRVSHQPRRRWANKQVCAERTPFLPGKMSRHWCHWCAHIVIHITYELTRLTLDFWSVTPMPSWLVCARASVNDSSIALRWASRSCAYTNAHLCGFSHPFESNNVAMRCSREWKWTMMMNNHNNANTSPYALLHGWKLQRTPEVKRSFAGSVHLCEPVTYRVFKTTIDIWKSVCGVFLVCP